VLNEPHKPASPPTVGKPAGTFSHPGILTKNQCILGQIPAGLAVFSLVLLFASFSCKDSPSASDNVKVTLTFEDASCIETWLQLKIENAAPPYSVALSRDGNTLSTVHILSSDTLLIDEGLAPSTTYTYRASLTLDNSIVVRSPDAQARTLDTTSHNWMFDPPVMLGDGSSSVLYDVAIISENPPLAYAVGAIYKMDSLGNWDPNAYNLVKWDGSSWELKRIPFIGPCSAVLYPPIKAIWAFSENEILVTNGGSIVRYDGVNASMDCRMNSLLLGAINKIWGSGPQDVYAVGNVGTIVRYDGTSWRRLESGTTLPIRGIYGARDNQSGQYEILCVAEAYGTAGGSKVLSLQDNNARELTANGLESWGVEGIWFIPNRQYVAIGQGVWRSALPEGDWWFDEILPRIATTSISGQRLNDIVVCGAFQLLGHWNGMTWQTYFPRISGSFTAVKIKANLVVAVGGIGNRAVAIRGRR